MIKTRKIFTYLLIGIIAIGINFDLSFIDIDSQFTNKIGLSSNSHIQNLIGNFVQSVTSINLVTYGITLLALIYLYKFARHIKYSKYAHILILCISFIASTFLILGQSFRFSNNTLAIFASTWGAAKASFVCVSFLIAIYLLIIFLIGNVGRIIDKIDLMPKVDTKFNFVKCTLMMIMFWVPYIIILFPATGNPDTWNQLTEFFGHGNLVINDYPISHYLIQGTTFSITNQHDFIVTIFYGTCVKIGLFIFKSANVGLFLASLTQLVCLAIVNTMILELLSKELKSKAVSKYSFIFMAFFPFFPIFGMYLVKNVFYSIFLEWFVVLLFKLYLDKTVFNNKRWQLSVFIAIILQLVTQKYAIYVILVMIIMIFFSYKTERKKIILCFVLPVLLFKVLISGMLFSTLNVSNGDPVESYSIPFQQTALYVKNFQGSLTEKEYKVLNKVFVVKNLSKLYTPTISDPVKSSGAKGPGSNFLMGYRYKTVKKSYLQNYWKTWAQMFVKHPVTYAEAYLNIAFGYFDMGNNIRTTSVNLPSDNLPLVLTQSSVYSNSKGNKSAGTNATFYKIRAFIAICYNSFVNIVPFSLLLNGTTYVWLALLVSLFYIIKRMYNMIIPMMPLIMQVPIIMMSPVNGSQRYMMPFILMSGLVVIMMVIACTKKLNKTD